ncbi:macrofage activating glycoprotein [Coprinopsis cinerea okayama7|uniref:Macrofage activating glycoprotein n=1 Tax=Coprinopsis cinerea (strain Okayama-7 / 130 / ATCC MYA-4618 / FGSC 9003) TaxID=240176 RepID=A8P585_COPC7|nr:macrofage activating glycoprotein [Coprinopsis cinerea okayama7\|eukprot:XP_001838882.1 macrofage activating glycoprotein [Coprinopsis cinerea okayama7\
MFFTTPSLILPALSLGVTVVTAQDGFIPHASKLFTWPDIPYKVDTSTGLSRGEQLGYNICNSTTEHQDSLCQTMHFNSIDDFCLWGPPEFGETVGAVEGKMVAWCTKPGHGTRLIPAGALTGVQWMRTPDYIQVVGFLDQTKINVLPDDDGGEMDPHGEDQRGNPMGGLMFTNAWSEDGSTPQQVIQWHNFLGAGIFCLKACDPRGEFDAQYCEHKLDRIGCAYNAPNNAQDGVFETCEGESQDFPGVYTDENGEVQTYTQPASDIWPVPYTPRIPSSSNCVTHTSAALYTALPTVTSDSPGPSETPRVITSRSSATSESGTGTGAPRATGGAGSTDDSETGSGSRVAAPAMLLLASAFSLFLL